MEYLQVYNLKNEVKYINDVQNATLNTEKYGLRVENGILFGTDEWFEEVKSGKIEEIVVEGVITNIQSVGQNNDSREYEITDNHNDSKSWWGTKGKWSLYKIGKKVRLTYVIQKLKYVDSYLGDSIKEILILEIEA